MPIHRVACIVQDDFSPFEFGVACEAFGIDRSDDGIARFDFRVVSAEPGEIRTNMGFSINVTEDLAFAYAADLVVAPPLARSAWHAPDPRVIDVIRDAQARGAWILSLCSGVFSLASAGVLDGRRATTHWKYTDHLAATFPQIEVDPDVLYVQDGRIISSAGTAASIDACLHLLRQELGAEMTNRIARRMVVAPQRDGGQAQFILNPLPEATSLSLAPIADWAIEHLDEDLDVERLAARAHMSPRTFARRFKADFGTTPAAWLATQRVLHARVLLEETDLDLEQIAGRCGFGSAAVLRQNFARALGISPTAYRGRFSVQVGS